MYIVFVCCFFTHVALVALQGCGNWWSYCSLTLALSLSVFVSPISLLCTKWEDPTVHVCPSVCLVDNFAVIHVPSRKYHNLRNVCVKITL